MNNYKIRIEELLSYETIVEANSKEEAIQKVKMKYYEEEIVLDSNNHSNTEFSVVECLIKRNEHDKNSCR